MYCESQRKPSPYPCLFSTLHIKTSIGLKFCSFRDTFPWKENKNAHQKAVTVTAVEVKELWVMKSIPQTALLNDSLLHPYFSHSALIFPPAKKQQVLEMIYINNDNFAYGSHRFLTSYYPMCGSCSLTCQEESMYILQIILLTTVLEVFAFCFKINITFPVVCPWRPNMHLRPSSLMASGRSILFPRIRTGTLEMVSSVNNA